MNNNLANLVIILLLLINTVILSITLFRKNKNEYYSGIGDLLIKKHKE